MLKLSRLSAGVVAGVMVSGAAAATDVTVLEEVTVTATREGQALAETPAAVGLVNADEIDELKASHPAEVMGKIPGVYVNVTGGEGHMTAIRQPITTNPVYLYLEDGIPTRSTGFFNHNALYEINLPQAGGIEVMRGPGSSLYGSDAIGGVINVLTRPAPLKPEADATVEAGEYGWWRLLLSGGNTVGDDGYRADLNLTRSDGWRDGTDYERQSATLRWDRFLQSGASLKTVISGSTIDQQTAGTSAISRDDYLNNPTINYTPISFRQVDALRISSAYEKEEGQTLVSITPYARYNTMELLPNWSLSYDPQLYSTDNYSLGLLAKYRRDFAPQRTRLIAGVDLDYSPGSYYERRLDVAPYKVGDIYAGYTEVDTTYDYDVTFKGVAPYLHVETSPSDRLRLDAGLRLDYIAYDYSNNLGVQNSGKWRRPGSTTVEYDHLSPKLGATYAFSDTINGYAAYRNSFRAPSQNQLFRQGQALNTVDLKPVDADSFEVGMRGKAGARSSYEVALYHMIKRDDIVNFRNTGDGTRETQNAGKTLHRGIEIGFDTELAATVKLDISYSYAKHTYEEWSPSTGINYSGNEISSAPRQIGDVRLNWRPEALNGGRLELNWVHLGRYWLDDENTRSYEGHDIFHLRANHELNSQWSLFGRIENLTDERYATSGSYSQFNGELLVPGLPRTLYAGVNYHWE